MISAWTCVRGVVLASVIGLTAGCGGGKGAQPPPPSVAVTHPVRHEVIEWDQYAGRLAAPVAVTVSARVSGVIEKAPFEEGAIVEAGQLLFLIDPRPFEADLRSKEAELKRAQSQLNQAEANFKRYEKLQGTRAISAEVYDEALAALQQGRANVGVAEAAVAISRLNLDWTKVTAPIRGRVSRKFITEGNLITGGTAQATQLTTLASVDPLYCYVDIPERAYLEYRVLGEATKRAGKVPAWIRLETEQEFVREGYVDFIDNQVDPSTGTVEIRAVVPNTDGLLTAGLFAELRIPGSDPYAAVLVPEIAIGTTQDSRFILALNAENVVEHRAVELGARFGKLRAIKKGISPEDRILTTGIQQLRPGTKVVPEETTIDISPLQDFVPPGRNLQGERFEQPGVSPSNAGAGA